MIKKTTIILRTLCTKNVWLSYKFVIQTSKLIKIYSIQQLPKFSFAEILIRRREDLPPQTDSLNNTAKVCVFIWRLTGLQGETRAAE